MSPEDKRIGTSLKKARTHLDNVIRMVEKGEYCVSVMQQNLAVIGLLKSANDKLLARHLNSCFITAMKGTNEKRKRTMIDEILQLVRMRQ